MSRTFLSVVLLTVSGRYLSPSEQTVDEAYKVHQIEQVRPIPIIEPLLQQASSTHEN